MRSWRGIRVEFCLLCAAMVVAGIVWPGCGLVPQTLPPQAAGPSNPEEGDGGENLGGGSGSPGTSSGSTYDAGEASFSSGGDGGGIESLEPGADAGGAGFPVDAANTADGGVEAASTIDAGADAGSPTDAGGPGDASAGDAQADAMTDAGNALLD